MGTEQKNCVRTLVREFLRDNRGSSIIIVSVGLLVLLSLGSLVVDALYLYVIKDRLQMTADIAALAAVQEIEDEDQAKATAMEYATKNMAAARHGQVLSVVQRFGAGRAVVGRFGGGG